MKMDDNEFETELRISADSDIRKVGRLKSIFLLLKKLNTKFLPYILNRPKEPEMILLVSN
jgi:hypothetical protein